MKRKSSLIADSYQYLIQNIEKVAGTFDPDNHLPAQPSFKIVNKKKKDDVEITEIKILVDAKYDVPAFILQPAAISQSTPCILALHQTTKDKQDGARETIGFSGEPNYFYAWELAKRGYSVIAPDYPFFGHYDTSTEAIYDQYKYDSVTMKGIMNHIAAINILSTFQHTNISKLGCIGHSLGGTNALLLRLFDKRLKCIVCSAGYTTFSNYEKSAPDKSLSRWALKEKYMPNILSEYKAQAKHMPFDFPEVLANIYPTPLFLSTPKRDKIFDYTGARECIDYVINKHPESVSQGLIHHHAPDCGHDFPSKIRQHAYDFLDQHLK